MANNVVPDPQPVTLEDAAGSATGTAAAPLRVDPTGTTTQPVSLASVPTHAVTQSGAWTVDPTTATAWGIRAEDAGHTTGDVGQFVLGVRNENAATLAGTELDYTPLATDRRGNTITAPYIVSAGFGDGASNTQGIQVGSTGAGYPNWVYSSVYNGSTWDRARGNTNGAFGVPVASTGGQALSTHFSSALSTTVTAVKASAGKLHGYNIYNPNSSAAFVQIFDLATGSVTLGTTTPKMSLCLPSNASATVGLDANFPVGIAFATAISVAATTTATGLTAPSTGLVFNAWYI